MKTIRCIAWFLASFAFTLLACFAGVERPNAWWSFGVMLWGICGALGTAIGGFVSIVKDLQ
jgi:hypothetical protein